MPSCLYHYVYLMFTLSHFSEFFYDFAIISEIRHYLDNGFLYYFMYLDHQGGQEGQQDDLAQVGKAEGGGHHKEALEPGGEEHQQQKHHTGKEGQDGVLVGG